MIIITFIVIFMIIIIFIMIIIINVIIIIIIIIIIVSVIIIGFFLPGVGSGIFGCICINGKAANGDIYLQIIFFTDANFQTKMRRFDYLQLNNIVTYIALIPSSILCQSNPITKLAQHQLPPKNISETLSAIFQVKWCREQPQLWQGGALPWLLCSFFAAFLLVGRHQALGGGRHQTFSAAAQSSPTKHPLSRSLAFRAQPAFCQSETLL